MRSLVRLLTRVGTRLPSTVRMAAVADERTERTQTKAAVAAATDDIAAAADTADTAAGCDGLVGTGHTVADMFVAGIGRIDDMAVVAVAVAAIGMAEHHRSPHYPVRESY